MDLFNRAFLQASDLFKSLSSGARLCAGLLLVMIVVSLAYLFQTRSAGPDTYLMGGEPFPASQLPAMHAAFATAGLMNGEFEGNRIKVPRGQQTLYMGALADAGALPPNFGTYLEKALASEGPFASRTKREESIKIAKQNELQLILSRMKDVESASVLYDEKKPGGFSRQFVSTASVSIKPVGSQPIEKERIRMIRHLVASAFAGLNPDNVSVSDLNGKVYSGKSHDGGIGSADDDEYLSRKEAYDRIWQEKISNQLEYIPGVVVTTNVELALDTKIEETRTVLDHKGVIYKSDESSTTKTVESPSLVDRLVEVVQAGKAKETATADVGTGIAKTSEETNHTNTNMAVPTTIQKREQIGLTPSRVKVAVAIPTNYYGKVWQERNPQVDSQPTARPEAAALEQIERQVKEDVKKAVLALLPGMDSGFDRHTQVEVTSFQHISGIPMPAPTSQDKAIAWLSQNWTTLGTGGLALICLLVLRSVIKSIPTSRSRAEGTSSERLAASTLSLVASDEGALDGSVDNYNRSNRSNRRADNNSTMRDQLASIVKEDPEAAVAILRNWIGAGA